MQTSSVMNSALRQEKGGSTRRPVRLQEIGSFNVSSRLEDTVATVSLAVLLTIVFALIY
jgi:hypothetical protein